MNLTRKKIVAGNWKMNLTLQESQSLVAELIGMIADEKKNDCEVYLFPSFIYINTLLRQTQETSIHIGAQNCSNKSIGAYTGETSINMLSSVGCNAVLIGHSERRTYYQETNDTCAEKINLALQHHITPFYCIGETLNERNANQQFEIIEQQLNEGIFHLSAEHFTNCVIAYEPIWAIGTGITATTEQTQEMHAFIRSKIAEKYSLTVAQQVSILYGGSCNEQNATELFSLPDVDGGLIGGASLKSRNFMNIIKAFQ
jgi:triosephosphate isomerase